jgi:hypothetical protein
MALTENRKINIWATISDACRMLWAARKQHVALAVMAYLPYPLIFLLSQGSGDSTKAVVAALWGLLWLVPLHILWQRLFLVGPELFLKVSPLQLLKMWLRLVGYYLGLFVAIVGAGIAFAAAAFALHWVWGQALGAADPRTINVASAIEALAFVSLCLIIVMRLTPTFVGIPVDERIALRQSWLLMEGNAARLLLTILLVMVPAILVTAIVAGILGFAIAQFTGAAVVQGGLPPVVEAAVALLLSPLLTAGSALWMAVMALVYRDLVPQPEHQVDLTV